jgi:hypothetical protein
MSISLFGSESQCIILRRNRERQAYDDEVGFLLWEETVIRISWSNDWYIELLKHLSHAIEQVLYFEKGQREETWSSAHDFLRYSMV